MVCVASKMEPWVSPTMSRETISSLVVAEGLGDGLGVGLHLAALTSSTVTLLVNDGVEVGEWSRSGSGRAGRRR